ncbi:hypothetical protein QQ045_017509 [Rhodiola kirilowii]
MLGACTYCKTKHARGHLGSYTVESLVERVRSVVSDGVREIWLSSEDTGAYGHDIGVNLPALLNALVKELPSDGSTMLRIGMTNPPFILEHLKEIAKVLSHPCVYSFLHVPVQSGSDNVLLAMNREYTVSDFRTVVDTLTELVPGMQIATDIICGFPGETDEDFAQTVTLIKDYKFSQVHNSQFYPRPGTPAARMKMVPSNIVKQRSRELTTVFESFTPSVGMEGRTERIWITEFATDEIHLVGHAKGYVQVLVIGPESVLGTSAIVKITSVGRLSVFGEVIETLSKQEHVKSFKTQSTEYICSPCSEQTESCACSTEPAPCACQESGCGAKPMSKEEHLTTPNIVAGNAELNSFTGQSVIDNGAKSVGHIESACGVVDAASPVDRALVGGIILSLFTIIMLFLHIGFKKVESN